MKILVTLLSSASGLFLFSTLFCGLWMRAKGATPEGVAFHVNIAVTSVVLVAITIAVMLVMVLKVQ